MSAGTGSGAAAGLPPLEYSDCFLDSPQFREIISLYEHEVGENSKLVKQLVSACNSMIQKAEDFSKEQKAFAQVLASFRFQPIGTDQTENELEIANSVQMFARLLMTIEDCRRNMLMAVSVRMLKTLENFRKEHIKKAKEEKKRFDVASTKYYKHLEGYLGKKEPQGAPGGGALNENDHQFEREKAMFRQVSFEYACRLQDVHAMKHYELIEPVLGYISDVTTFLHQTYEEAISLKPQLDSVQFKVQLLRETHESEQEKAYHLKARVIEDGEKGMVHHPEFLRQGHVMVQEKRRTIAGTQWNRYFMQFCRRDKTRLVKFVSLGTTRGAIPVDEWLEVQDCIRQKADEADRRFCFDLFCLVKGNGTKIPVQAVGYENRKGWLEVMEGREPAYTQFQLLESKFGRLSAVGYRFVEKCIETIESRGLDEEGLYRRPGVLNKANKLVKDAIEKNMVEKLDFSDEAEWDTKTLASSIKAYLMKQLGEPLLTFKLHSKFIESAKINDQDMRVDAVADLVSQLPDMNKQLLLLLMTHLRKIADNCSINLMKASNLGVVFGPTLMRPERETVASIVDIRYQNIIVECIIRHIDEEIAPSLQSSSERHLTASTPANTTVARTNTRRQPPAAPGTPESRKLMSASVEPTSKPTIPEKRQPERPVAPLVKNQNIPPPPAAQLATTPGSKASVDHLESKPKPPVPAKIPPKRSSGKGVKRTSSRPVPPAVNTKPTNIPNRSPPKPPSPPPPKTPTSPPGRKAKALFDCDAEDDCELSFHKDEILHNVHESDEPDWLQATKANGVKGLVPENYVEFL